MCGIKKIFLLICAIVSFSITFGWSQHMWSTFQYNNQRTGRCPYFGPETSDTLWTYTLGGAIFWSSPAIAEDGTIYFGCQDGYLYAINPDGSLKWTYVTYGEILSSPAIGTDGTIYFGSSDKYLYAIEDSITYAKLRWTFAGSSYGIDSPILIGTNGTVYAIAGNLYAIDIAGNLKWSYNTGIVCDVASVAMSLDGSCLYTQHAGPFNYYLACVDTSGSVNWERDIGGAPFDFSNSIPTVGSDGVIYFPTGFGGPLYAINTNGIIKWSCGSLGDLRYTSPCIGEGDTIYMAGGFDGNLHAITPDGTLFWTFSTQNSVTSSPIIDGNGIIYVASYDTLYAINPDGTIKWVLPIESYTTSTPAMDTSGTIYLCSGNKLYAIGSGTGFTVNPARKPTCFYLNIYPNPFKSEVSVKWSGIKKGQKISLRIYDLVGRLVKDFSLPTPYSLFPTEISWDREDNNGRVVKSGVYYCQIKIDDFVLTKKIILVD